MTDAATNAELADAIAALTARVEALECPVEDDRGSARMPGDDDRWWLLRRLEDNTGPPFQRDELSGSLAYGGRVTAPGTGTVVRQLVHAVPDVLDGDLETAAHVLGALGHPLRLEILRRLLLGARTLSELQEIPGSGTAGQLNHHLRELRAAGLVVARKRNDYAVPSERVVPVLVILGAALGLQINPPVSP